MPSESRQNRITIDLQHYKQSWIDYCASHGTTPSEAFRMVVAKLTGGARGHSVVTGEEGEKVRREIRLTRTELHAAEALADQEGFAFPRWVVALVRARLTNTAHLGQRELELLARSNMQVLALGRNINQIAKALHGNPAFVDESLHAQLDAIKTTIRENAAAVAGVLEANVKRWSTK